MRCNAYSSLMRDICKAADIEFIGQQILADSPAGRGCRAKLHVGQMQQPPRSKILRVLFKQCRVFAHGPVGTALILMKATAAQRIHARLRVVIRHAVSLLSESQIRNAEGLVQPL